MEFLAATGNRHKLLELQTIAKPFGVEIISPKDIAKKNNLGELPIYEETGKTYKENALIKAKAFYQWSGIPSLGDDSGLEIEALDNRPGLLSARYAGKGATDDDLMKKVLAELEEVERATGVVNRRCFYRCSLALVLSETEVKFKEDSLEGEVLYRYRGEKGFGYDPIILMKHLGKTLAEVDFSVTCSEGFRAHTARSLFRELS